MYSPSSSPNRKLEHFCYVKFYTEGSFGREKWIMGREFKDLTRGKNSKVHLPEKGSRALNNVSFNFFSFFLLNSCEFIIWFVVLHDELQSPPPQIAEWKIKWKRRSNIFNKRAKVYGCTNMMFRNFPKILVMHFGGGDDEQLLKFLYNDISYQNRNLYDAYHKNVKLFVITM